MKAIMGLFHVSASLTGPTGRTATLDLLVDTGATLLVVPRSLADQLEILALRTQPVQIAGDRKEVWPVAEVRVAINGREVTTPCFIAPGGPSLLGAVALESLFLAADPVAKRLVPVEGFVGLAARRESSLHILFSSSQNDLSFLQRLHHVAQELSLSHRGASAPPHARYAPRPSPGALPRRRRLAEFPARGQVPHSADHPFSSFLSSLRNLQSVPSAINFCGLPFTIPASRRRSA